MKYNTYIKGETKVSEIGLGAWQLGASQDWKSMNEKEAIQLTHHALDLGVNFFDTAPNYGLGTSETRLGKALKGKDRSKIVINTKFGHTVEGSTNYRADHIRNSLEGSLKRLQMDYVDSLIIHNPPFETLDGNKNDHYEVLEKLQAEGKIRAYGASLDTSEEMDLFMKTTDGKVIEAFFNILHQDTAKAFGQAMENEVAIIAKIPLDSGWLSGKYHAESNFEDIRTRWSRKDIQTRAALVDKLKKLIGPERSLAQTALGFCLAYPAVSTVIPGNASIGQLKNNVLSAEEEIPHELIMSLEVFYRDEVKPLGLPW